MLISPFPFSRSPIASLLFSAIGEWRFLGWLVASIAGDEVIRMRLGSVVQAHIAGSGWFSGIARLKSARCGKK